MGMPAPSAHYYTVDDVLALPSDGNRYELVYGELVVSPSPTLRHQLVVSRLFRLIANYSDAEQLGRAFFSPADLTWGRSDVLAQPDVFVIGTEDSGVRDWSEVRRVPLIVEVLSPSTKRHDRFGKRRVYQDRAVDLYWIIDPDAQLAEVWTPDLQLPGIERERLMWYPQGATAPLMIDLAELLAD
jgi:Uma2 family endonuclease